MIIKALWIGYAIANGRRLRKRAAWRENTVAAWQEWLAEDLLYYDRWRVQRGRHARAMTAALRRAIDCDLANLAHLGVPTLDPRSTS